MKFRIILICFVFILTFQNSKSQGNKNASDSIEVKKEKNSLRSGMWGIQFGIGSDFTLTNFEGAVLSIKRQFSSNIALRLGFNGKYILNKDEKTNIVNRKENVLGLIYC